MTTDHSLSAEDLHLSYGDTDIISGLSLELPAGDITGIVGANACGKSTLLKSMSRLLTPRRGRVILDGRQVHSMPAK